MKLKKLLLALSELVDADRREQVRNYEEMKKILKKLKKKRDHMIEDLEHAEAEESERIRERLEILVSQRKKGIEALKEIKRARDHKKKSGKSDARD
ncbi:MAG: hypothetical protein DWQ08_08725 [Proteobacteria bacterium]|nr:MAG: hypothetical protein DWQ08_08725 [Pseudomonadota bacterium]